MGGGRAHITCGSELYGGDITLKTLLLGASLGLVLIAGPVLAQGVNEFMFVLGQARIKGAVQMIINSVALW